MYSVDTVTPDTVAFNRARIQMVDQLGDDLRVLYACGYDGRYAVYGSSPPQLQPLQVALISSAAANHDKHVFSHCAVTFNFLVPVTLANSWALNDAALSYHIGHATHTEPEYVHFLMTGDLLSLADTVRYLTSRSDSESQSYGKAMDDLLGNSYPVTWPVLYMNA